MLHPARRTIFGRTFPRILRPGRIDQLRSLDQATDFHRRPFGVIPVVLAAANDQRGDLDSVEHLVLDAGNGLTRLGHERVEPAQHYLEKLVAVEIEESLFVVGVLLDALAPLRHLRYS